MKQLDTTSRGAKSHLLKELDSAMLAAENMVTGPDTIVISTLRESPSQVLETDNFDWHYTLGHYRTWATAEVKCTSNPKTATPSYEMKWTLHLRDNYHFENTGLPAGFVTDSEMVELFSYGKAKPFLAIGSDAFTVTWLKGQRHDSGAQLNRTQ